MGRFVGPATTISYHELAGTTCLLVDVSVLKCIVPVASVHDGKCTVDLKYSIVFSRIVTVIQRRILSVPKLIVRL